MASYTKLGKNNWKVSISLGYGLDGKRKRIYKQGFKLKSDAEKYVAEITKKQELGYYSSDNNSNILFKDFILDWFYEYKSFNLAVSTRACYIGRINTHIIPMLGRYRLNEINNYIMQKFYNYLINKADMKPSAAKKVFEIVNGCLKYAKKQKLIVEVPTDIEKFKAEDPKVICWSKEEVEYFLNEIRDTSIYTPILIEVFTGLRVGELCAITWRDFNLDEGWLLVDKQIVRDNLNKKLIVSSILKTATSNRKISIPKILIDYLNELKAYIKPSEKDLIIHNGEGGMINPRNLSMAFTRAVAKYKEPKEVVKLKSPNRDLTNYKQLKQITFHGLRHTHATMLMSYGENVKTIADRLGHKDIKVTLNTYTHVMNNMKKETANLLDAIFC